MPNWCNNKLTIKGSKKELDLFIQTHFNNKGEFDFNTIVPEQYDDQGDVWYNWRISNWGTKWNACYVETYWETDTLIIMYDTAWSPSLAITFKLLEMYPELDIEHSFYEGGMDIAGRLTKKGIYDPINTERFAIEEGFIVEDDYA